MERKSKIRIPDTFGVALTILGLSTLPYFHELITDSEGLKPWVPVLGIEKLLTTESGILGFSTYRVLLYTSFIFIFSTIGYFGWYESAKNKFYRNFILLATISGTYHILLILLDLRRTFWNDPVLKIVLSLIVLTFLLFRTFEKDHITFKRIGVVLLILIISLLPFYHEILTLRTGELRSWIPDFGIAEALTDQKGYVRGLGSYRVLVYFVCLHVFSHVGWICWFFDSRGKRYRAFLLVPSVLSLYQVVVIFMSWQETEFNSPDLKLYLTLIVSILLALNFYYNNKVSPVHNPKIKNTLDEKN